MNKPLSGWQLFGIFIVFFIVFAITKSILPPIMSEGIGTVGDIILVVAIVVGIRNHLKSRQTKNNGTKSNR